MFREAVIALALLVPAIGRAQSPDAVEEASRRFQNGVADFDAGDFRAASAEFERAYELTKRWEVLFNIGVSEKKLFRYREAIDALDRYLREGGSAVPADRRADVIAAEAEIRGLVAEVTVIVEGEPAKIEVDGLVQGATPLAGSLLLTSGHHEIAARRGDAIAKQEIDVQSGNQVEVRLVPIAPPTTAHLTVRSHPLGASLTLDDHPLGLAPWVGDVDKGGHTLGATLAGRNRVRQEITVDAGQNRDYLLELPEPAHPWYKHWYVLAALGAIVVGGVTVLYVETRTNSDVIIHYPN